MMSGNLKTTKVNTERMVKRLYESPGDDWLTIRFNGKSISRVARTLGSTYEDAARWLINHADEAEVGKE